MKSEGVIGEAGIGRVSEVRKKEKVKSQKKRDWESRV